MYDRAATPQRNHMC